jgi:hypothetical protein
MEVLSFPGSKQVEGPELDLFNLPLTNKSTVAVKYERVGPNQNVIDNNTPITFTIARDSDSFVDLHDSFLYVKAKIQKANGSTWIATDPDVAPGNLFLHTFFQDVKVKLNDQLVSTSGALYPYIAWIQTQLNVGEGVKSSKLSKEIYYKDTTDPDDYTSANDGFVKRLALAKGGKQFEMVGRLQDAMFEQKRYIPNTIQVDVELNRSDPNFCLSSANGTDGEYRVIIDEICLHVKRRVLEPEVYKSIQQKFSKSKKAKFPILQTQMHVSTMAKGAVSHRTSRLFNGLVPQYLCIGIVEQQAFAGRLNKSPFNFKSKNLTKLAVTLNGQPLLYNAMECDFKNGEYLLAYNTLFGCANEESGNGISMAEYLKGNALYVFDLSKCPPGQLSTQRNGAIEMELFFADSLEEHYNLIVMGKFQQVVQVDRNGLVDLFH